MHLLHGYTTLLLIELVIRIPNGANHSAFGAHIIRELSLMSPYLHPVFGPAFTPLSPLWTGIGDGESKVG
jgi:hypothetical protein